VASAQGVIATVFRMKQLGSGHSPTKGYRAIMMMIIIITIIIKEEEENLHSAYLLTLGKN
jgi:hypothetical protein